MPFGSVASVHAWHRIGSLLRALGRRILKLALLQYVDDFFGPDRAASVAVAKEVFARLVRACLGDTSISEKKLEHGNPLVILGVLVTFGLKQAHLRPSDDKVEKWVETMKRSLKALNLPPGLASKIAGQLQWTTQAVFKGIGRALIRPIIAQSKGKKSTMDEELRLALEWWIEFLESRSEAVYQWDKQTTKQLHMFADARGNPARIAAILFKDGAVYVCDAPVPDFVLAAFKGREDNQIMGLEIMCIALGKGYPFPPMSYIELHWICLQGSVLSASTLKIEMLLYGETTQELKVQFAKA